MNKEQLHKLIIIGKTLYKFDTLTVNQFIDDLKYNADIYNATLDESIDYIYDCCISYNNELLKKK